MKDVIFTPAAAIELNQLVQSKLSRRLFLCCNFNPNSVAGLSDDGKYYPAILNLYNLAFDSSCIIKNLSKMSAPKIYVEKSTYEKLRYTLDTIKCLRSRVGHNNSYCDGHREAENIEQYQNWVKRHIGKESPDCAEDYTSLLGGLLTLGNDLFETVKEYIIVASNSPDKNSIVVEWESLIIDWYSGKNVKRDIFLGELENEYLARAGQTSMQKLDFYTSRWIQNYYTKEGALHNLQRLLGENLDLKTKQAISNKIRERENCIFEEIRTMEKQFGNNAPYCFRDRLFAELSEELHNTLLSEQCSLLPDDLLQRQIQKMFAGVSSLDGHFK